MLPGQGVRAQAVANFLKLMLRMFSAIMLAGFTVLLARDLVFGSGSLVGRALAIAVLGVVAALLFARQEWSLGALRFFELAVFGSITGYLAGSTYIQGADALANGGAADAAAVWSSTLLSFALLAAAYGIFVPNGQARAAVVIAVIALVPVGIYFLVAARHPELAEALGAAASGRGFESALWLATAAGIGLIAASVGSRLFESAFEARKSKFYDLEEKIGAGGMGEVWKATHRSLARPAAIKLIREDMVDRVDKETAHRVLTRFEREAKATARLRSPHTIEVYDFGLTEDGHFFYAMEYLEGLDLETLVKRFGPMPFERAIHLLVQACDSLADAHDHGLTHRDIKPANLHVGRLGPSSDHVKLLDFGLVKTEVTPEDKTEPQLTAEGTTSGTPAYMAPEMATNKSGVDGRADIYALGCVAYWLLTGERVFEAETNVGLIVEHVKTPPLPPSQRTELEIPSELEQVILKCLEKDPGDRYQDARELADALAAVPAARDWDKKRANDWWELHLAEEAAA